jgi:hypothetical protein
VHRLGPGTDLPDLQADRVYEPFAPKCIVYASRGAVEDSGAQGGQGVQATADREHFLWRIDQFEQLGFSEAEASQLAESDADLGQARHLLATGCSLTLALQILL